jgi:hypothetical protein
MTLYPDDERIDLIDQCPASAISIGPSFLIALKR